MDCPSCGERLDCVICGEPVPDLPHNEAQLRKQAERILDGYVQWIAIGAQERDLEDESPPLRRDGAISRDQAERLIVSLAIGYATTEP